MAWKVGWLDSIGSARTFHYCKWHSIKSCHFIGTPPLRIVTTPPHCPNQARNALSLQAAAWVTGMSKRTLWRRLGSGQMLRGPDDRHGRATLLLDQLRVLARWSLSPAEWARLLSADDGDAEAQMEWAVRALEQSDWIGAHYWLEQAARQQNADAMHWLATLAFEGRAGPADTTTGLLWLAKAARLGHSIAQAQMAGLRVGGVD